MPDAIPDFVRTLDRELAVIREVCEPLLGEDAVVDPASGAMLISHRPKVAPEAYAFVLFPGVPAEVISRYEEIHSNAQRGSLAIPSLYRDQLARLNGASMFEIHLYGLPRSMSSAPPLLNRSVRQPMDLATANRNWSSEYKPGRSQFHIGGGPYSYEDNLGYFFNGDGSVDALRKGGVSFGTWPTFGHFLVEELARAASLYPSYEDRWFEFRQQLEAKELERKNAKRRSRK